MHRILDWRLREGPPGKGTRPTTGKMADSRMADGKEGQTGVRQGSGWLEAEDPSFRAGFLEGSTALATAAALPDPPLRVHLPQPSLGV